MTLHIEDTNANQRTFSLDKNYQVKSEQSTHCPFQCSHLLRYLTESQCIGGEIIIISPCPVCPICPLPLARLNSSTTLFLLPSGESSRHRFRFSSLSLSLSMRTAFPSLYLAAFSLYSLSFPLSESKTFRSVSVL
ncbi:hypothetical protein Pfo_020718, partial [Paulownia fortunei]